MTNLKKTVFITTSFFAVLTVLFIALTLITDNSVCLTLAITFGTTLYHFAMRLLVGKIVPNNFNYKHFWFRQKRFEEKFYKLLGVKRWKDKMPSYNPRSYMTKFNSLNELIATMCRNEVIHEVIAVLSFFPIAFSSLFGAEAVFIITSIFGCLFDLIFVIMQRYNRPRVVRLMQRQNRHNAGK